MGSCNLGHIERLGINAEHFYNHKQPIIFESIAFNIASIDASSSAIHFFCSPFVIVVENEEYSMAWPTKSYLWLDSPGSSPVTTADEAREWEEQSKIDNKKGQVKISMASMTKTTIREHRLSPRRCSKRRSLEANSVKNCGHIQGILRIRLCAF